MSGRNSPKYVLKDSKTNDTAKGLANDLTIEVVTALLTLPCAYCGITKSELKQGRIGVDRKDSSLGHVQNNVIQACSRCNFLKGDMPYAAWEVLIPAVRSARERGLFGNWIGGWVRGNKKHK